MDELTAWMRRLRREDQALCRQHHGVPARGAGKRQAHPLRGPARRAARSGLRHLSLHHLLQRHRRLCAASARVCPPQSSTRSWAWSRLTPPAWARGPSPASGSAMKRQSCARPVRSTAQRPAVPAASAPSTSWPRATACRCRARRASPSRSSTCSATWTRSPCAPTMRSTASRPTISPSPSFLTDAKPVMEYYARLAVRHLRRPHAGKICPRPRAATSNMWKRPSAVHIGYVSVGAERESLILR